MMKLKEYGVKVTIFDPDDKETRISITVDRIPREKVLTIPFPLADTLKEFEEAVND
jgi:hypothetical protein